MHYNVWLIISVESEKVEQHEWTSADDNVTTFWRDGITERIYQVINSVQAPRNYDALNPGILRDAFSPVHSSPGRRTATPATPTKRTNHQDGVRIRLLHNQKAISRLTIAIDLHSFGKPNNQSLPEQKFNGTTENRVIVNIRSISF